MTRDPGRVAGRTFDVVVLGGGIHGLFAAREAALRGASVALVERGDFGGGLSFNHQRTVHGGLRALEHGNVTKVVQQIGERRRWAQLAPALIRPLPFLVPLRRGERPSRGMLSIGLRVYDLLGGARNADVRPAWHLPASRIVTGDEARQIVPELPLDSLTGAAVWYDYQTVYPDRLNYLVAAAADDAGACLLNHAEAIGGLRHGGRFAGLQVRDALTGDEFEVRAKTTIIAAGTGLRSVYQALELDDEPPPVVAAANMLVKRPAGSHAIAVRGPSGRRLTAVPWAGQTLVGTFQGERAGGSLEAFPISVDSMLAEANAAFPWLTLARTDVSLVHRGLVPAETDRRVELLPDSFLVRHELRGVPGVISIVGVKFTTARLTAAEAVRAAFADAGIAHRAVPSTEETLPFATPPDTEPLAHQAPEAGIDIETSQHLADWYGGEAAAVIDYAVKTGLLRRLTDGNAVIEAEIAYAVEHASARRLSDAVLRRTWLGAAGDPGTHALERAAAIMGDMLGWSDTERAREIEAVRKRYAL